MGGYLFTLWIRFIFFDPMYAFFGYFSQTGLDSMLRFVALILGLVFWIGVLGFVLATILFLTAGGNNSQLGLAGRTLAFSFLLLAAAVGGLWLIYLLTGYLSGV